MQQLMGVCLAIGSLTLISHQPAMVGVLVGVSGLCAIISTLGRTARKIK